jgi:hypothetical protein
MLMNRGLAAAEAGELALGEEPPSRGSAPEPIYSG